MNWLRDDRETFCFSFNTKNILGASEVSFLFNAICSIANKQACFNFVVET